MASKGRARSPTQLCPSEALDCGNGSFLPREEWAQPRGRKCRDRGCGPRRSRRSRRPASTAINEAVWGGIAPRRRHLSKVSERGQPDWPGTRQGVSDARTSSIAFDNRCEKSHPDFVSPCRLAAPPRPAQPVHQPAARRSARSVSRRHAAIPTRKAAANANISRGAAATK